MLHCIDCRQRVERIQCRSSSEVVSQEHPNRQPSTHIGVVVEVRDLAPGADLVEPGDRDIWDRIIKGGRRL